MQYTGMLLSFFVLSLAIRNVWPRHMSLKAFLALYILLLAAGMPVTLLACIPYGLFGILAAACIFGLVYCRETAAQNVCMSMIGCRDRRFCKIPFGYAVSHDFVKAAVFFSRCGSTSHFAVLCFYVVLRQGD